MKRQSSESEAERPSTSGVSEISNQTTQSKMAHEKSQKRVGKKPGRKPSKIDQKAKLERSRQSARECRARKKLRYQYLEELVLTREKSVFSLRDELEMYKRWCRELDQGILPDGLLKALAQEQMQKSYSQQQTSPQQSQDSVSTASPGAESDPARAQQHQPPATLHETRQLPVQSQDAIAVSQQQFGGQYVEQPARQFPPQLCRQPSLALPALPYGQQHSLTSMHRGSRSFEDASLSLSSSSSTSASSSSVYRSGSVPNLASSFTDSRQHQREGSEVLPALDRTSMTADAYSELGSLRDEKSDSVPNPRLIPHRLPRTEVNPTDASWMWHSSQVDLSSRPNIFYPSTPSLSLSNVKGTVSSTYPKVCQSYSGDLLGSSNKSSMVLSKSNFALTPEGFQPRVKAEQPVPFYQRPRSSSDVASRRVSATSTATSAPGLSQQQVYHPSASTTYGSQDPYTTISETVATCLTLRNALPPSHAAPQSSTPSGMTSSKMTSSGMTPVCLGSDLTASISEPIPHWYSFLDDLESAATLSARQGAFSEAGTPASSRTRSGPGTPSSVDSPYSQQQQLQQVPSASSGGSGGADTGNIPSIVTDLLDDNQPS